VGQPPVTEGAFGVLSDTPTFGPYDWYAEGAEVIRNTQNPEGAWLSEIEPYHVAVRNTCFGILFLKRATRPLVASEDRLFRPKQK
jgi:hypothetical protein